MKDHKYSGSDAGLAFIYFYNPLANKLVECLPNTIAPNTLTFLGFIHTLIPMALMFWTQGPEMYGPFDSWLCFVFAWCYFAYRMLDEMDGKQARRTQNSSAMGLVFDHGCDAFSIGMWGIMTAKMVSIGNNALMYILIITLYACFHFATLEEYYIGTLRLPVCNGVSDGSIAMILLFIVTGIMGADVWTISVGSGKWLHMEGVEQITTG